MRWGLVITGKPLTENAILRANHWGRRAEMVEDVIGQVLGLAAEAKIPRPIGQPVGITARPLMPNRANRADVGAHFPWVKAAIDGLVRRGCLPDDNPDHVRWLLQVAPEATQMVKVPTLHLEITTDLEVGLRTESGAWERVNG